MEGDELLRWYQRSPDDLDRVRSEAAEQKHADFVASIGTDKHGDQQGDASQLDVVADAFHKWQSGPKIPRPNFGESFIPIVGPAWEAVADVQDGNYAGAAFNGAMAVADALPIGAIAKGFKAASKGVGILKGGSVTADASRKVLRRVGLARPGEEIHHAIALKGTGRNVQDWRNHFAFLKSLPKAQHRRLTGSWMGAPRYDPIRRVWYGTTDWMKTVPAAVAGYGVDAWQNVVEPTKSQGPAPTIGPPRR